MSAKRLRRRWSSPILEILRSGREGISVGELEEGLGCNERSLRRALYELRRAGVVHPVTARLAYDEPWPEIGDPVMARVLRQIRSHPRSVSELARSMGSLEDEPPGRARHRDKIYRAVSQLGRLGLITPGSQVWLSSTLRAPR